jgi:DNA-binding MarR family transcriptional regulator
MKMKTETIAEFRRALRLLENEIGINLSGETECCGVTTAQCHLILELERYRDGTSLTDLAESLRTDKSALSRTLDSLVRDGLATRVENPENRRKISAALTKAGTAKADFINGLCNASYEDVFARIPKEKHDQIVESVGIIAEAMRSARKKESDTSCCKRT